MNTTVTSDESPKFYEADGALRAFSNRAILFAIIAGIVALVAVLGFIMIRMQPPTVIKVSPNGEAEVVGPKGTARAMVTPSVLQSVVAAEAPTPFEKEAYVRTFLDHYLNYDQHTLPKNWADALNMMTSNLRREAVLQMQTNDAVGKLQDQQARSESKISSIEVSKQDPLVYTAFGVRTLHHMSGRTENVDEVVEAYKIRLAVTERTVKNPTGLYIAEYTATQIHGEAKAPKFDDGGESAQ
jgi:type IV secretory pathway component VirB8